MSTVYGTNLKMNDRYSYIPPTSGSLIITFSSEPPSMIFPASLFFGIILIGAFITGLVSRRPIVGFLSGALVIPALLIGSCIAKYTYKPIISGTLTFPYGTYPLNYYQLWDFINAQGGEFIRTNTYSYFDYLLHWNGFIRFDSISFFIDPRYLDMGLNFSQLIQYIFFQFLPPFILPCLLCGSVGIIGAFIKKKHIGTIKRGIRTIGAWLTREQK